nr:MAG TPA_asm: hypothetical protein [Caudoviricetes sp.]
MEQNIVKLQISNEYIQGSGVSVGAAGSHDDVLLEMDFRPSTVWAGTTRRAIFSNALGENRTVIVLTTNLLEEGQGEVYLVPVPQQAKDVAGECFLTVEGFVTDGSGKEIVRCVTEEARFRVLPSKLYTNDSAPVTPSQAEQLQAEIDSIKTTIVNAGISERNAAASAAAALESKNGAVSARDLSQAYLQQSIQYYTRTEGSAARAAASALQAAQRAKEAQAEAQEAEAQANRAQAEADRATVPAVAGIYNIIIPDRTTGEKYAVLFEDGKLYLLGVAATMQATDFVLVDSASGKNYRLGVENKLLIVEEV